MMPFLFQRSNGIYYIIYELNGKKKWRSTGKTQKSKAFHVLLDFDQSARIEKPRRVSYPQFVTEFLSYAQATYSPGTTGIYKSVLLHFQKIVGEMPLRSIGPQQIDQYKVERMTEISPVTVNIELRSLKAAFQAALRWGLITEHPFRGVLLAKVADQQPVYIKEEELKKLLAVISERWLREVVVTATLTGMRRGELLNLEWTDIDFERRLILVQSKKNFKTKAGRKRSIPMNEAVYDILRRRSLEMERCGFAFSLNGQRISGSYLSHSLKKYIRLAGLDEKLHFHSLRHTFATWLVQRSVSIYEVQKTPWPQQCCNDPGLFASGDGRAT